jgi:hypothetical protein
MTTTALAVSFIERPYPLTSMSVAPTIAIFSGCGVAVCDTDIPASVATMIVIAIVLLRSIGVRLLATEGVEQRPQRQRPDVTVAVVPGVEACRIREKLGAGSVQVKRRGA